MKFAPSSELFPPKPKLTYGDLDKAHDALKEAIKNGNENSIKIAEAKFDAIEMSLKKLNAIPAGPEEEISYELDKEFPDATNKRIVTHKGSKYQLLFELIGEDEKRRRVWKREWVLITDPSEIQRKELFPADDVTLEEYEELNQRQQYLLEADKNDTSDKASWLGRTERRGNRIREVSGLIYKAEISLKKRGILPSSPEEGLEFELDKNAAGLRNGEVLEFGGKFYKLIFYPLAKSNSGKTVHVWGRRWEEIEKKS